MDWICLNIYTTHMGSEPLCAMLLDLGITGGVINDPYDINEFVANKTAEWDYIDEELADTADKEAFVTVYLSNDADGIELLNEINNGLLRLKAIDTAGEYGRLETDNSSLSEEDWANNWKQYFKPIEIGEKILIKPTWETIPENNTRVIVELDPDSSFGTGRHFTTQPKTQKELPRKTPIRTEFPMIATLFSAEMSLLTPKPLKSSVKALTLSPLI